MSQAEGNLAAPGHLSAGRLKGSARGALIGAMFGTGWLFGTVAFSGHATPVWLLAVTAPAVALVAWAVLCIRAFRQLVPSPSDVAHWRRFRALFWTATLLEWILVSLTAVLLARARRYDLIPQSAGVIVGLHFFPLAIAFRARRYYWLGGIMISIALGCLLLPRSDLRSIICCALMGLCLWGSSAFALSRLPFRYRRPIVTTTS